MDRTGLIDRITVGVSAIDRGRRLLDTAGEEGEGRISYHEGLDISIAVFEEVQSLASIDLELLILAEYMFLAQERELCTPGDTRTINSLAQALLDFDGAFLALSNVDNSDRYKAVEECFPRRPQYRYKEMPKDAFHVACSGHITRIENMLKTPGINLKEKKLLQQRCQNIKTAQAVYFEKQKNILSK